MARRNFILHDLPYERLLQVPEEEREYLTLDDLKPHQLTELSGRGNSNNNNNNNTGTVITDSASLINAGHVNHSNFNSSSAVTSIGRGLIDSIRSVDKVIVMFEEKNGFNCGFPRI